MDSFQDENSVYVNTSAGYLLLLYLDVAKDTSEAQ